MVKRHAECSPETCMLVIENVLNPWGDHIKDSGVKFLTVKHLEHILGYHNGRNRIPNEIQQKRIAITMKQGWEPSHKTLAFNKQGVLVDGQNRTAVAVKYNQSAVQNVTVGLREDYFEQDIPDLMRRPQNIIEADYQIKLPKGFTRVLNRIIVYRHPEEGKLTNLNAIAMYDMYQHDIRNARRRVERLLTDSRRFRPTAWRDIEVVIALCEMQNILEYVVVLKSWMEVDKSNKLSVDLDTYVEYFYAEIARKSGNDFKGTDIIKTVCIAIDRVRDGTYKEEGLFGIGQYGVTTEFQELVKTTGKPMPFNSTYYDIIPIK